MMPANIFAPKSRQHQLVIQELPDEILIYDLEKNKALCLNHTAAFVWQNCDGQNSVSRIAHLLSRKLKTPIEETVVWFALRELEEQNLLESSVVAPVVMRNMNRRQLIGTLGKATAVAIPMVIAITAPSSAAAASCGAIGSACSVSSQCCSTNCQSNRCCLLDGQSCSSNSDCCGGSCIRNLCNSGCVLYDTPIMTADGETIKAADVFVGQELLGINCINGEKIAGRVKELMKRSASEFYSLTAENGDTIHCSSWHPLINGFGDKWGKRAELFREGDSLLVYDEKLKRVIEAKTIAVERIDAPQPVITFEMDTDEHTFISGGIVSHNPIVK